MFQFAGEGARQADAAGWGHVVIVNQRFRLFLKGMALHARSFAAEAARDDAFLKRLGMTPS